MEDQREIDKLRIKDAEAKGDYSIQKGKCFCKRIGCTCCYCGTSYYPIYGGKKYPLTWREGKVL